MSGSWDDWPISGGDDAGTPIASKTDASVPPRVSSPPVAWLVAGIAATVGALAVPVVSDSHVLAVFGWLLGGAVAILLLAAFVHFDLKRRSEGLARDSAAVPWLRRALVLLAGAAVTANAWTIADAVARGNW